MMFEWLSLAAWPIVKKVFTAIGVGIISYSSLGFLGTQISDSVASSFGTLGGAVMDILTMAGFPQAMGIILGGFNARLALKSFGRLGIVASS